MNKIKEFYTKVKVWLVTSPTILLVVVLLGGCAAPFPVVQDAPQCNQELAVEILNQPCVLPADLPASSTFEVGLKDDKSNREALKSCANKVIVLQTSAKNCAKLIAKHNEALKEINK